MGRKRPVHRRKRLPAAAQLFMLGGVAVGVMAIISLVIAFSGLLDAVYMDLTMNLPKFGYVINAATGTEDGNEIFKVYQQMRYIGLGAMGAALIYAGIARVLETESLPLIQAGTSNKIVANSLFFVLIFLVFPPIWDVSAQMMDDVSLWVLNPLYTFDDYMPCPAEWYEEPGKIQREFNESKYRKWFEVNEDVRFEDKRFTERSFGDESTLNTAEIVCRPEFKVRYVFLQVIGPTDLTIVEESLMPADGGDFLEGLTEDLMKGGDRVFANLFLGLTKALITMNILVTTFVIGVMADVFLGMLIAALPLLMFLSLLPRMEEVVGKFITAIPGLFMLPIMSATILVVGAGFIVDIGVECVTPESCAAIEEHNLKVSDTLTYAWIASLAVVFLAITLPVMLAAILTTAVHMAQQQVTSGMQTGMMVTGMMASGAVGGGMQSMGGAKAGTGVLSKLGMGLSGAVGGGMHGMMRGSASAGGHGGGDLGNLPGGKEMGGMMGSMGKEFKDGSGSEFMSRLSNMFGMGQPPGGTQFGPGGDHTDEPAWGARPSGGKPPDPPDDGDSPPPPPPPPGSSGAPINNHPPDTTQAGIDTGNTGSTVSDINNNVNAANGKMDHQGDDLTDIKSNLDNQPPATDNKPPDPGS